MNIRKHFKVLPLLLSTGLMLGCVSSPSKTNNTTYPSSVNQQNNQVYQKNTSPNYKKGSPSYKQPKKSKKSSPKFQKKVGGNLTVNERKSILNYHNQVRKNVKVKPLKWSPHLTKQAYKWARKLKAQKCTFKHSSSKFGENLFMGTKGHYKVVDAAKSWEKERPYYRHRQVLNQPLVQKAGHYTQMVWRKTTQLGCAKVTCGDNLIVVCNYNPAGNFIGQKAY